MLLWSDVCAYQEPTPSFRQYVWCHERHSAAIQMFKMQREQSAVMAGLFVAALLVHIRCPTEKAQALIASDMLQRI